MNSTKPSALNSQAPSNKSLEKIENALVLFTLTVSGLFTVADIFSDIEEGASALHLSFEGLIALLSFICMGFLWRRKMSLYHEIQDQKKLMANAELLKEEAIADAKKWRNEASNALKGLSDAIDTQLTRWQLTAAEKEVALLLLKGLSLKEVADVRSVSEKTARAQSFAIYAKSGLSGRAELSAFFLEDLMLPVQPVTEPLVKDLLSRPNSFI